MTEGDLRPRDVELDVERPEPGTGPITSPTPAFISPATLTTAGASKSSFTCRPAFTLARQ